MSAHTFIPQPVRFFVAGLLTVLSFANPLFSIAASADDLPHFEGSTRVLLGGPAATQLIDYCGRMNGTKDGLWQPSEADLDGLDTVLAPLLAADLESEGATESPGQYYRQYAAGIWESHRVIYVNGFHERHLQLLNMASFPTDSWRKRPVIVDDGGPQYWCAIFIKDTGKFVVFKQEGRPKRTVVFHGLA